MSEKGANLRERSQRFRRRMSGKGRAVSPVVATLILILIAVAAASALYLWLVTWQGSITGGIGNQHVQSTLTIGGSTSVYPFDQVAVSWFQQNETDVAVTDSQGGSGAGMLAVCNGAVQIGAASFPVNPSLLVSNYGCSPSVESTIVVTTVAYDGVDPIVQAANPHGLLSINYDTYALIYEDASVAAGGHPSLITHTYDGGVLVPAWISGTSGIAWNQIPAAVGGAALSISVSGGALAPLAEGPALYGASAIHCGPSIAVQTDLCVSATGTTPCGQTICAGGSNDTVLTSARSDPSGTTQSFEARLIDATSSTAFATAAALQGPTTGFSGCGSSNFISDCGYVANKPAVGNPGVIAATAASADTIGYASHGLAAASGSGVVSVPYMGVGQSVQSGASPNFGGIVASDTTIKSGILFATTGSYANGYLGWRPFDLVTLNTPAATAAAFLTFVTNPYNNQELANAAQELSIYVV
ncbi:MAG: substrate-binding domain-containing protein [Thermoplasmata archaeon]